MTFLTSVGYHFISNGGFPPCQSQSTITTFHRVDGIIGGFVVFSFDITTAAMMA